MYRIKPCNMHTKMDHLCCVFHVQVHGSERKAQDNKIPTISKNLTFTSEKQLCLLQYNASGARHVVVNVGQINMTKIKINEAF